MTMTAEDRIPEYNREGDIGSGGFRYRDRGAGDTVVWLGPPEHSPAMLALLASQFRVLELARLGANATAADIIEALATLGIDRFGLIAAGDDAATGLRFALDCPQAVTALALLAPTLMKPDGRAGAGADEALIARLGTLAPPLLAVFGTRDTIAPPEAGRHYRERLASCNVVFVYDAGAAMGDERPEAVAALIGDFLRRRDEFLVRQISDLLYP